MDNKIFAAHLRDLRRSRHLTLQSVGDAVGSGPQTISNFEHSRKSPSLNMVAALAEFFGVSVKARIPSYCQVSANWTNVAEPIQKTSSLRSNFG